MFPEIALSPAWRISTWGLCVALAGLVVLWRGRRDAPARGIAPDEVERLWPALLLGGFAGAHLYYLLAVAGWPRQPLPLVAVLNVFAGTAVQGGLIGGTLAAAWGLRRRRVPFFAFCDALSPAGAWAQALARVGCFAAGCCYGRPTDAAFGVVYASPLADPGAPRGVPVHPAQLYEAVLSALLALALGRLLRSERRPGAVFAAYVAGAAAIRFAVEFFRDDDRGRLVAGLAHSQFMALALLAAALALRALVVRRKEALA